MATIFDDGVVVYLNGVELLRANMPSGAVGYTTLAPSGLDDYTMTAMLDPRGILVAGTNVLAVEVHQVNASSSNLHFELALQAVREEEGPSEPGAAVWRRGGAEQLCQENPPFFFRAFIELLAEDMCMAIYDDTHRSTNKLQEDTSHFSSLIDAMTRVSYPIL